MPRGRKRIHRRIAREPFIDYFKPVGVPLRSLESEDKENELSYEEYEVLRLIDYLGKSQTEAGESMGISQPSISRILTSARKKVAEVIIEGYALKIIRGKTPIKIEHKK